MIRPSYHHFGDMVDFDQDVVNSYEMWRMMEAHFEASLVIDSTDPQALYE